LTGNFDVEKLTTSTGQVVRLAVSNLGLQLGTFVTVTNGSGTMLVDRLGIAAKLQVSATFNLPGITLVGGTIGMDINTRTQPVDQTFRFGVGLSTRLRLAAGPFGRVTATGASLKIGTASDAPTIAGDFFFDQVTNEDQSITRRIGVANGSITISGQGI